MFQISITIASNEFPSVSSGFGVLEIGTWDLFGIWDLVLGI
jgi:hypothetical protein